MPLVDLAKSGFILFAELYKRKYVFEDSRLNFTRERSFKGTLDWALANKWIRHISKNNLKSSKIPDYTRRGHVVLRDVK